MVRQQTHQRAATDALAFLLSSGASYITGAEIPVDGVSVAVADSTTSPQGVRSGWMYFQPTLLKGKVALVTGGGSGIGYQIAYGLGRVGASSSSHLAASSG